MGSMSIPAPAWQRRQLRRRRLNVSGDGECRDLAPAPGLLGQWERLRPAPARRRHHAEDEQRAGAYPSRNAAEPSTTLSPTALVHGVGDYDPGAQMTKVF